MVAFKETAQVAFVRQNRRKGGSLGPHTKPLEEGNEGFNFYWKGRENTRPPSTRKNQKRKAAAPHAQNEARNKKHSKQQANQPRRRCQPRRNKNKSRARQTRNTRKCNATPTKCKVQSSAANKNARNATATHALTRRPKPSRSKDATNPDQTANQEAQRRVRGRGKKVSLETMLACKGGFTHSPQAHGPNPPTAFVTKPHEGCGKRPVRHGGGG